LEDQNISQIHKFEDN